MNGRIHFIGWCYVLDNNTNKLSIILPTLTARQNVFNQKQNTYIRISLSLSLSFHHTAYRWNGANYVRHTREHHIHINACIYISCTLHNKWIYTFLYMENKIWKMKTCNSVAFQPLQIRTVNGFNIVYGCMVILNRRDGDNLLFSKFTSKTKLTS